MRDNQKKVVSNVISDFEEETFHDSLPHFSNTSGIYFKKSNDEGHLIEQLRVYKERKVSFDWNHQQGEHPEGVVHVHEWRLTKKQMDN